MFKVNTRGQSLTELAIYLAIVLGVFLVMRVYIQRSFQAKYKAGANYLITEIERNAADKGIPGFSGIKTQYDPYYRETRGSEIKAGETTVGYPEASTNQTISRTGWEKTGPASNAD